VNVIGSPQVVVGNSGSVEGIPNPDGQVYSEERKRERAEIKLARRSDEKANHRQDFMRNISFWNL